ncbi:MAG: hypothetical protein WC480_02160 [Patescibacteria group bacterium]
MLSKSGKQRKIITGLVLIAFLFGVAVPAFLMPQRVEAAPVEVTSYPTLEGIIVKKEIKTTIWDEILASLRYSIIRSGQMLSRKLAVSLAKAVAEGKNGLQSLTEWRTQKAILLDASESAAGEFIGSFSENFFGDASILCNPNPNIRFMLGIALFESQEPTPICNWREIQDNWNKLGAEFQSGEILLRAQASFSPTQSDAGAFISSTWELERVKNEKVKTEFDPLKLNADFHDVVDPLSGYKKSSRDAVKKYVEKGLIEDPFTKAGLSEIGAIMTGSLLIPFVDQFLNTLVAELMSKWLQGLWGVKDVCDIPGNGFDFCTELTRPDGGSGGGGTPYGTYIAESADSSFADLLQTKVKIGGEYDIVAEFVACPAENPGFNNCTINQDFADAIYNKLTVQEAIDQDLLNGNWSFGYSSPQGANEPGPEEGYSMSAIRRLRKARIVPAGWEFAAELIGGKSTFGGSSYNLNSLISDFNNPSSQFYGLVDPNWVLKAPQQKCTARVPGPINIGGGTREEWCAESQDCVLESEDGSCKAWGHCTRERNIWWFDGDECPSNYATCQSFVKIIDGQEASFLKTSLNYQGCDSNNKGCKWYAGVKNAAGQWLGADMLGQEPRFYFDRDVQACSSDDVGCTELIKTYPSSGTNLVKNGSFEDYLTVNSVANYFPGWKTSATVLKTSASTDALVGQTSILIPTGGGLISQTIPTGYALGSRTFTLSFAAKNCDQNSTKVHFGPLSGTTEYIALSELIQDPSIWDGTQWNSYYFTYTFPSSVSDQSIGLAFQPATWLATAGCLFDAVQLEEANTDSGYKDYGAINTTYLKIKPDYLNCPGTPSDPAECSNYAKSCGPDDVGCQKYTALASGIIVPGIVKPEDYCPAECVGYRTYKRMASRFQSELVPLYFMAPTAQSCTANDSGCEEFTNLDSAEAGGESLENYSFLRRCQKPNPGSADEDCAAFYTWEGSDRTGYQLKLYQLKRSATDHDAPFVIRNPVYSIPGVPAVPGDPASCEPIYAQNPGDPFYDPYNTPNCRQFYSATGQIRYRLYADTVLCTQDCHNYRMSNWYGISDCAKSGGFVTQCEGLNLASCNSQGGFWQNGICYNLLPGQCSGSGLEFTSYNNQCIFLANPANSVPCGQSGCQEYRGNFSGSGFVVGFEGFEGSLLDEWIPDPIGPYAGYYGVLSSEAFTVGGHSFTSGVGSAGLAWDMTDKVQPGRAYILTVWAKSDQQVANTLKIRFSGINVGSPEDQPANYFSYQNDLATDWRFYRLGPVFINWTNANDKLLFYSAQGKKFYVDNVQLEEVRDVQFLVQNSWSTPASCDQNHSGAAAPQYMLGCEAYQDSNANVQYLKSFTRICSEGVVGCEALINTYNSPSPFKQDFSRVCTLPANTCIPTPPATTCDCTYTPGTYAPTIKVLACQVNAGERTCRYNLTLTEQYADYPGWMMAASDGSADEVSVTGDQFIYAVNNPDFSCQSQSKGCTKFALPRLAQDDTVIDYNTEQGGSENLVYFLNQPTRYTTDLCTTNGFGCEEYNGGGNLNPIYFKDPRDKVCEYRQLTGQQEFCWYQKGADVICPIKVWDPGTNTYVNYTCGEDNQTSSSQKYWAQLCPSQYSSCTKFIDPNGSAEQGNNEYYYLDNNALDTQSCNGQVSLKEGCVLFADYNKTDWAAAQANGDGNWLPPVEWSSDATYISSENQSNSLVGPIDCSMTPTPTECQYFEVIPGSSPPMAISKIYKNNTNQILKVRRDRVCAEWVDCSRSFDVFDANSGSYRQLCMSTTACSRFQNFDQGTSSTLQCISAKPISAEPGFSAYDNLSIDKYTERDLGWAGYDYSGYSVPWLYPTWSLQQVPFGKCTVSPYQSCINNSDCSSGKCDKSSGDYYLTHLSDTGKSLGLGENSSGLVIGKATKSCRGYPETTSPFPGTETLKGNSSFAGSNFCSEIDGNDCDCFYEKWQGDSGPTAYFDLDTNSDHYCTEVDETSGKAAGDSCANDQECMAEINEPGYLSPDQGNYYDSGGNPVGATPSDNDVCVKPSRQDLYVGWRGYCLQSDRRKAVNADPNKLACLLWMPLDLVANEPDVFNSVPAAGWQPSEDQLYCLQEKGNAPYVNQWAKTESDTWMEDPPYNISYASGDVSWSECRYERYLGESGHHGDAGWDWSKYKYALSVFPETTSYDTHCGYKYTLKPSGRKIRKSEVKALILDEIGCLGDAGCPVRPTPQNIFTGVEGDGAIVFFNDYEDRVIYYKPDDKYYNDNTSAYDAWWNIAVSEGGSPLYAYQAYVYLPNGDWFYAPNMEKVLFSNPTRQSNICLEVVINWSGDDLEYIQIKVEHKDGAGGPANDCESKGGVNGWNGAIALNPVFVFKEYCEIAVQVTQEVDSTYIHAANTNYLKEFEDFDVPTLEYRYPQNNEPFGKADLDSVAALGGWYIQRAPEGADQREGGSPYSCHPRPGVPLLVYCGKATCFGGDGFDYYSDSDCSEAADCGDGAYCLGLNPPGIMTANDLLSPTGRMAIIDDKISKLFAMSSPFSYLGIPTSGGIAFAPTFSLYGWDNRATMGQAPVVRAAVFDETIGGWKEHSARSISVNYFQGDAAEPEVGYGQYWASLSFYAYNSNGSQMPLRYINIDWGGKDYEADLGSLGLGQLGDSYQNHRSSCDGTNFGSSGDACVASPWSFDNLYIYNPDCIVDDGALYYWDDCYAHVVGLEDLPENHNPCCVYKPRVQVIDNWGICGADCGATTPGNGKACVEDYWLGAGSGTHNCSASAFIDQNKVWTSYNGVIAVIKADY